MTTILRTGTVVVFAALLGASLFQGQQAQDKGGKGKAKAGPPGANHPERLQALIITGQNPHDWRGTTPSLRKTLDDTEKFETRVVEEFRGGTPEMLAPTAWFGERADNAISDFVRTGKGLVLYHLSLGAFDGWADHERPEISTYD
jgi:hypothetical protein